jgi:pilus assembly protein Flp/PilA
MIRKIMNFIKEEEGAGLAEYAILLLLIALVSIAILTTMGTTIAGAFQRMVDGLTAA